MLLLQEPAGDVTVDYGSFARFTAIGHDVEDGANCCTLRWASDVDGQLGVSRSIQHAFAAPGVRTVTVTATDNAGATSAPQSLRVDAVNRPPAVTVDRPGEGEGLRAREYVFRGAITDVNEPDIDCVRLVWSGAGATEEGCRPRISLRGLDGPVVLTITGTDELGVQTVFTRNLTVTPIRPDDPPDVEIFDPPPNQRYSAGGVIPLHAEAEVGAGEVTPLSGSWTVTTPRGTQAVTTVTTTTSGTTLTSIGEHRCGAPSFTSEQQTLRFSATDDDGTESRTVSYTCIDSGR